ncbi:transposase family protein [Vibrio alginolyticus]|uniref:transposase family protein n=1 Tax=Vibrio alginolyticus TaxID=663 RepID=UPI003C12FCA7
MRLGSIEDFGQDNLDWLQEYGYFTNDVPVHGTIARVINLITAKQQRCFAQWMKDCHEAPKIVLLRLIVRLFEGYTTKLSAVDQSIWIAYLVQ